MANQQNGQSYYTSHAHPNQQYPPNAYAVYGSQAGYPRQDGNRTSSFSTADQSRPVEQQTTPGGITYTTYDSSQDQGHTAGGYSTSLPYRANTQTGNVGGYQQQYGVAPQQYAHTAYNPAQYQPQQPQYNPQSYTRSTSYNTTPHQPYNPAAYQPTNYYDPQQQQQQQQQHQNAYPAYAPTSPTYGMFQHGAISPGHAAYPAAAGVAMRQISHSSQASPPLPPPHETSQASRPFSFISTNETADIERHTSFASRVSSNRPGSFGSSPQPSMATPPASNLTGHSPSPSAGVYSSHPHGRPLPGVPSESESDSDYFAHHGHVQSSSPPVAGGNHENTGYGTTAAAPQHAGDTGPRQLSYHSSTGSPAPRLGPDEAPTHLNGNIASTGENYINYGAFSDDSDAEAAAGLAAMQALDEQEAREDARRLSAGATLFPSQSRDTQTSYQQAYSQGQSSDSDGYGHYDPNIPGGGYSSTMRYGTEQPPAHADYQHRQNLRMNSVRSTALSSEGRESQASGFESIPPIDSLQSQIGARNVARVDTGGTGGLTEPSPHPRRLSFDEGDETTLNESKSGRTSGSTSPSKDMMPDLFFHPGMSPQRPLPPPPTIQPELGARPAYLNQPGLAPPNRFPQYAAASERLYPNAPDSYAQTLLQSSLVPRSTSLSSQRSSPANMQPIRSKTDADRIRRQQQLSGQTSPDAFDASVTPTSMGLDLPAIPRKRFNPAKLTHEQFKRCSEPWALSSVLAWIRDLAEEETDLKESEIVDGIIALFLHKVPTMNTTEAEALGDKVVKLMLFNEALLREEEWVKFGSGMISGVLFQLTGTGCYSSKLHVHESRGRCYSYHCMRTLKKVNLEDLPSVHESEDWATYYKLTKQALEGHERKEIERQNVLHEVVTSEDGFIRQLDVLKVLYKEPLETMQPAIIPEKRLPSFLRDVFGQVDKVKKVNQDHLLAQLKYRQKEQGPWIVGFSDIFREWIRRARSVYVEYASNYPRADYLMRREVERNLHFKAFLDRAREDKRAARLGWDSYLKGPITRLQRYSLLLQTVHKNMIKDSEEKTNLAFAIDEIRAATFECDSKLAEMEKKMELIELGNKLKLRPPMEKEVELNLDHLGREIIIRGDLLRAGGKGFQWVDTHAILFDHYLVLSKVMAGRDRKHEYYDVSKVPIPMDLIILESTNDLPVVKSSLKGVGTVTTTVAAPRGIAQDPRLTRTQSVATGPGTLIHTNTSTSMGSSNTGQSLVPATNLDPSKEEKIMYPFRVKHLGKSEIYTLYAPTQQNRQDWCEAIISAKTRHAEALFAQNAEPFRLRVLADTAFGYDGMAYPAKRLYIRGTPLDRAIKEAEKKYEGQGRPSPVCRATVNCATVFQQPVGRLMCAVGTDYGVYISEYQNPRGWVRAVTMPKVAQVAVLEEFNLFLLLSDKALIAYHLDVVCPPSGAPTPQNDSSSRKAPQKLSGSKDVGFFVTGKMKDRALVFYKKKDGITSIFKVLEPILQKSTTSKSRFLPSASRRGQTEFFREYDEFYIPADCYSLNLFSSSLAISTARGVQVLTLDKKQPWDVPNLRSDEAGMQIHLSTIASRIKDLKPLGMFRLGEAEFLVTYEDCAVYVNKHGDISRGVVLEFVGRAKAACLHGQFLILFDDDFVEIRDAQNGRLKQVIAGRDIKMLDDGGGGTGSGKPPNATAGLGGGINGLGVQGFNSAPRTVKICMQHPEQEKSHVIVELVLTGDKM